MTPLVSVVIPTFNRSADLKRALQSVIRQTFQNLEVIVVDNNSSDDTTEVVARFNDPRISLHRIENGGIVAKSRNLGVLNSRGRYVAFLDSDDWWSPRKLDKCVARLEAGADVVYHDLHFVTSADQTVFWRRVRACDLKSPVFSDLLRQHAVMPQSSVVIRRDLLITAGGVPEDPDLVAMEDFICWLNVARATEKFARVRGTLGYYWAGGGNLSSDARTLQLLDRFEARYATDFASERDTEIPAWVSYARGRAYFRSHAYAAACHHLLLVRGSAAPWRIRAKAWVTRMSIALRRLGNRVETK